MSDSTREEDHEIQSHFDLDTIDLLNRTATTLTEGTAVSHQLGVVAACHAVSSANDPEGPLHVLASIPTAAQPHRFVNTLVDPPSGRSISKATYSTLIGSSAGKSFTPGAIFDTGDDMGTNTGTTHLYLGNIDEYDSKTARALTELMQVGSYSVGSAPEPVRANTALFCYAPPKYGTWDEYEPIREQIPGKIDLQHAVDVVVPILDTSEHRDVDPMAPDEIEMVLTTGQTSSVTISDDVRTYAEREASEITPTGDDQGADAWPQIRVTRTILKLAVSMAKFEVSDVVTTEHVDRAANLLGDINESLGVNPDCTDEFDADVLATGTARKTGTPRTITLKDSIDEDDVYKELVVEKINTLCNNEDDDPADINTVLRQFDDPSYDQSSAEKAIEQLKQLGQVYESSTNTLRACRSDHIADFYGGGRPDMKQLIAGLEGEYDEGVPVAEYYKLATETHGLPKPLATYELERLKQRGKVYNPSPDHFRTT